MKRAFDFTLALLGLLLASPLLVVIVVAVWWSSPGGVFFVHTRLGRSEKPFRCYKFRTMTKGAPVVGSHEVAKTWITPIGKVLRNSKLDELPQLVNVILGDMSLVGPRPCLPSQTNVINARRALDVFTVRPGITGFAQLLSVDMSTPEKLAEMDYQYIKNQSFRGDTIILVSTVANIIRRKIRSS